MVDVTTDRDYWFNNRYPKFYITRGDIKTVGEDTDGLIAAAITAGMLRVATADDIAAYTEAQRVAALALADSLRSRPGR